MKLALLLGLAASVSGAAYAEKFDLTCKGTLTLDIPLTQQHDVTPIDFRFGFDTDAKLARRKKTGEGWEEMRPADIYPDRLVAWIDDELSYTISRTDGSISSLSVLQYAKITYAGTCKKAKFTPLPATKF